MEIAALVQNYFKHLAQRNLDGVMDCIADQVERNVPGDERLAPWTGKRSTKKEVREFYRLLWENAVPLSAEIHVLLANESDGVVTGTFSSRMKKTGKVLASPFSIHLQFKNGLITKYVLMEDSFQLSQCMQ